MRAPRLLAAVALPLLLAGCGLEKPTPLVTVVSGGSSVHSEAVQYCFEGQTGDDCAELEHEVAVVRYVPGDQVGVDVSKELADHGWRVTLGPAEETGGQEQTQSSGVLDGHYFAFPAPNLNGAPLRLVVEEVDREAQDPQPTGRWEFVLAPR